MNDPLRTLESLQAHALQEARLALAAAQREYAARRAAWEAARDHCARAEEKAAVAHQRFADAQGLLELRWTEHTVRAATLDLSGARARVQRAECAVRMAEQRLREAEARVRESTLGHRSLGQVLEQRELSEQRRAEQRAEDEVEDLYRAFVR